MGVDTIVSLSYGTRIRDVADVIAILLGRPRTWYDYKAKSHFDQPTDHGWTEVEGITFKTSDSQPECCTINIEGIGNQWWLFYHFESEGGPCMLGRSRAERICLHKRLAQFFGGRVIYNDCDNKIDYRAKAPAWLGKTEKDSRFHEMQLAKWNLQPMTPQEIARFEKHAAYKTEDQ